MSKPFQTFQIDARPFGDDVICGANVVTLYTPLSDEDAVAHADYLLAEYLREHPDSAPTMTVFNGLEILYVVECGDGATADDVCAVAAIQTEQALAFPESVADISDYPAVETADAFGDWCDFDESGYTFPTY